MKTIEHENKIEFNVANAKSEIAHLLEQYRIRKDELEWVSDDWEEGEIQEELDEYAREIQRLKVKIKEYEHSLKV